MQALNYNDFRILAKVGVGTVGTLYQVQNIHDDQVFALKLLSDLVSNDKLIVARFQQEMLVLSRLSHPNIVSFVGSGTVEHMEDSNRLFFVMEFVAGETIKELVKEKGPFSWLETAECGRQICSALQHMHNQGIIHRDLKPGNIFVNKDGQIKLVDFGIAKDLFSDGLTDAGLTVGTYKYMPPELIRGNRDITGQVDLYALGCNLFEMLAGRPPFLGDNFAQIFDQHLKTQPPRVSDFASDCPLGLVNLIDTLLSKEPHARPFNARSVQGQLTDLIGKQADTVGNLEIDQLESNEVDVGAASIRLIQNRLSKRVALAPASNDVSWERLGYVLFVVISLIVVGVGLAQIF